jgi:LPXTG-motif cell wall-anchored protein
MKIKSAIMAFALGFMSLNLTMAQELQPLMLEDIPDGDMMMAEDPELMPINMNPVAEMGTEDAEFSYQVINISQENAQAQSSGANPGDVLRYELKITSDFTNIENYIAEIDVSDILKKGEIIDAGLGEVYGNILRFPAFSQEAPCERIFSFFVRIKPCDEIDDYQVRSTAEGIQTQVPINCGLAQTGPGMMWSWMMIIGAALLTFFFWGMQSRSKN